MTDWEGHARSLRHAIEDVRRRSRPEYRDVALHAWAEEVSAPSPYMFMTWVRPAAGGPAMVTSVPAFPEADRFIASLLADPVFRAAGRPSKKGTK